MTSIAYTKVGRSSEGPDMGLGGVPWKKSGEGEEGWWKKREKQRKGDLDALIIMSEIIG